MIDLTETQLSLQHILGDSQEHRAWHSSFPKNERNCPYCQRLHDLESYMQARIDLAGSAKTQNHEKKRLP